MSDAGRKYPATPTFLIGPEGKVIWEKAAIRHWSKSVSALESLIDRELKKEQPARGTRSPPD